MKRAITHQIPDSFGECLTTFIQKQPIDLDRARLQWRNLKGVLESAGLQVEVLECNSGYPDAPFVEDTVVSVNEVAVVARSSAPSRRPESRAIADYLSATHEIYHIEEPGYLEGGDVLRNGRTFYVGISGRTNEHGFKQFRALVKRLGYGAHAVPLAGCLHLKTACTFLDQDTLLFNPSWVNADLFPAARFLEVQPGEPFAGNTLRVGETVLAESGNPRTLEKIRGLGFSLKEVCLSEFLKAEAGLTCLSVLL